MERPEFTCCLYRYWLQLVANERYPWKSTDTLGMLKPEISICMYGQKRRTHMGLIGIESKSK